MSKKLQWESMEPLLDEWNNLVSYKSNSDIFDLPEWQQATVISCCKSMSQHEILTQRDTSTGELLAIVPLSIANNKATFLSDYNTTDFQDLLIRDQSDQAIWHEIIDLSLIHI